MRFLKLSTAQSSISVIHSHSWRDMMQKIDQQKIDQLHDTDMVSRMSAIKYIRILLATSYVKQQNGKAEYRFVKKLK